MSGSEDRKKIESILGEPLTRHRFALNSKIRAAQAPENPQPFTLDDFKSFADSIPTRDDTFKSEVLNALEAVQTGKAAQIPLFNTPEKQLLWGATLAYLKLNPDAMKTWQPAVESGELSGTGLWKQVTGTKTAYQELLLHAHHVRETLRDKDTKYAWSEPGVGFAFSRDKNVIQIDLMQTMIVGFEHARADVYREIGRAFLTINYPQRMQQVFTEMQPLLRKARAAKAKKGPDLKPDEYKKLRLLSAEWSLRQMMFDAAEENVSNRFVANVGKREQQDHGVSLNNTAVTQRAIGLTRLPEPENASEELRRYLNLCNTVMLSFFQNNNLFENTNAGWNRVGVDPGLVRQTDTLRQRPDNAKDDGQGISHADFQLLRELCGGPQGLENLQPKAHERLYGPGNMTGRLKVMDKARKEIIEKIWELYAEELIQKILQQTNDQVEQQMKEAQQNQQDQDQDGEGQEGEGQEQEGEGQESEGQGQGQGQGQGKGKPQKGQKDKQKKKPEHGKQQGERQDEIDDGEDADGEGSEGQKGQKDKKDQKGQKGDKQDQDGEKSDGSEGDEQGEDGQDQEGEGAEGKLGADDQDSVPVEGMGEMPGVDDPTETPSDEVDPDADAEGQDADGDGQDADGEGADGEDADGEDADGKTMEELEKEAEEAEAAEGEDEDEDADGEGQDADGEGEGQKGQKGQKPGKGKPGKQAGHDKGKSLEELAKQDWTNYPERIKELSPVIQQVRSIFKKIQEMQLQRKSVQSKSLEILPEDGEIMDRFNREAHQQLTIKKLTGSVEEDDLKRFHVNENEFTPTEVDIVIAIDGSGSMNSNSIKGGVTALQSALQSAAILYEAAAGKDMNMNVYVCMWGNNNPPMMIKPGDDRVKIGQAMESMRRGLNSGTDFSPAVKKVAETMSEQTGKSGTLTGFTHILVISDGDSADREESKKKVAAMFEASDKVTFDVAVISSRKNTQMESMAKDLAGAKKKPAQQVGVVLEGDPNKVPMAITGLLLDKVRKCGSFTAIPSAKKRRQMKTAINKMDKRK